jgi:hypothetical protein
VIGTSGGGAMNDLSSSMMDTPFGRRMASVEQVFRSVQAIHFRYQQRMLQAAQLFEQEMKDFEQLVSDATGLELHASSPFHQAASPESTAASVADKTIVDLTQAHEPAQNTTSKSTKIFSNATRTRK